MGRWYNIYVKQANPRHREIDRRTEKLQNFFDAGLDHAQGSRRRGILAAALGAGMGGGLSAGGTYLLGGDNYQRNILLGALIGGGTGLLKHHSIVTTQENLERQRFRSELREQARRARNPINLR